MVYNSLGAAKKGRQMKRYREIAQKWPKLQQLWLKDGTGNGPVVRLAVLLVQQTVYVQ